MDFAHLICLCYDCGWRGRRDATAPVETATTRLWPGESAPPGRCPACGEYVGLEDPERYRHEVEEMELAAEVEGLAPPKSEGSGT